MRSERHIDRFQASHPVGPLAVVYGCDIRISCKISFEEIILLLMLGNF